MRFRQFIYSNGKEILLILIKGAGVDFMYLLEIITGL